MNFKINIRWFWNHLARFKEWRHNYYTVSGIHGHKSVRESSSLIEAFSFERRVRGKIMEVPDVNPGHWRKTLFIFCGSLGERVNYETHFHVYRVPGYLFSCFKGKLRPRWFVATLAQKLINR